MEAWKLKHDGMRRPGYLHSIDQTKASIFYNMHSFYTYWNDEILWLIDCNVWRSSTGFELSSEGVGSSDSVNYIKVAEMTKGAP